MFLDKKHQPCSELWHYTIAKDPRTSRAFPRPRGQRLLAETDTHRDRTRAGPETPKEASSQSQLPRKAGHPNLKLGARIGLCTGGAAPLPQSPLHFYGGGLGRYSVWKVGVGAPNGSWSCICTASHPLYLRDNACEARKGETGRGALRIDRGCGADGATLAGCTQPAPPPPAGNLPTALLGEGRAGCLGCFEGWCVADPLCFVTTTPPLCPPRVSGAGISQVDPQWKQASAHRANEPARQPQLLAEQATAGGEVAAGPAHCRPPVCFKCY